MAGSGVHPLVVDVRGHSPVGSGDDFARLAAAVTDGQTVPVLIDLVSELVDMGGIGIVDYCERAARRRGNADSIR